MKRFALLVITAMSMLSYLGHSEETASIMSYVQINESDSIRILQPAIDAYSALAKAAYSNDLYALEKSREAIKACKMVEFHSLVCENSDDSCSFKGHLVFDEIFADFLIQGKDAFENSDIIKNWGEERGQMKDGEILTKNCFVKAHGKNVYSFPSTGYQELVVMAEPNGKINIRINVINKDKHIDRWYNDTTDLSIGRNIRKRSFTLPNYPNSIVTLEVDNCSNNDITFVIISN